MCQESFAQEAYYSSVLNSSLVTLFALLARQYQGLHPLQEPSLKDAHIYEILIYIAQNLATVTLESLAQKFQYTPAYISRLNKKHTGKSFSKTVQTQRIARAAQYLKATELPVIEIASLSGFSDLAYFNKAFKATFGLTPTGVPQAAARAGQGGKRVNHQSQSRPARSGAGRALVFH